jgi:hypothetical protein
MQSTNRGRGTRRLLIGTAAAAFIGAAGLAVSIAQTTAQGAEQKQPGTSGALSGHVPSQRTQAQEAPLAHGGARNEIYARTDRWLAPGSGATLPESSFHENPGGKLQVLNTEGPLDTAGHPFFTPLGSNQRACVTCHQPADGMSISAQTVRARWEATQGTDPLFAAVDGSNCPSLPQDDPKSHSLLLEKGLFRVFLPWPPKAADGTAIEPEFTLEVVEDPTGCNTDPKYGLKSVNPMVSVYRRPRVVANLKYIEPPYAQYFNLKTGTPLAKDPETGARVSMNLMADARNPTLKAQAVEAAVTHLQRDGALNESQLERIVAFERQIYVAQGENNLIGKLAIEGGPPGLGATAMAHEKYGLGNVVSRPVFLSFDAWRPAEGAAPSDDAKAEFRASVARGSDVFFVRPFWIRDATGLNNIGLGNPLKRQCATCHNASMTGHDVAPGWIDLGTQNLPMADPMPDLPMFKLTCRQDVPPHPYLGRVIYTHDPGRALITGKCIAIGAINLQQMRGLAARAPYFSNGSASNLREVVDYYDRRFDVGYSEQEKQDLVNFLSVL